MSLNDPKVVVVGAGAIGGLFGGLLAEGGLDVTLIDVNAEHVAAIQANGLHIVGHGGDRFIPIQATTDPGEAGVADVAIVQCKAMYTEDAVRGAIAIFSDDTIAVSFQNGLGNEEVIAGVVGEDRVIGGLTAQGATVEAPGRIRNYSDLPSYVGELFGGKSGGTTPRVEAIAAAFTRAGLDTHASADIRRDMWKKLLGNIGLSATSGTTDLTSAEMVAVPELAATIQRAVDEAHAVATACGVDIPAGEKSEILDKLTSTTAGTGASKSSLCTDLRHRRPTEIDRIYGTVSKLGVEHGVPTPTLDTLIAIVKGLESGYRRPDCEKRSVS